MTMVKTYRADCIVLKRRNYGETDRWVTVLTKEWGKKTVLAKGIRRINSRRSPHLELFSHAHLMIYSSKSVDIVTEATTIDNFVFLRERLERIAYVYIALELIDQLVADGQGQDEIFFELHRFLTELNNVSITRNNAGELLTFFKHFLLTELGFMVKQEHLIERNLDKAINEVIETQLKSPLFLTRIQKNL